VSAAATARRAGGALQLARWSLLAVAASAWWIVAYAWEVAYAVDVTGLAEPPSVVALGEALGLPSAEPGWILLLALAPAAVAVGALVLRVGADRVLVGALLTMSLAAVTLGAIVRGWPAWLPVPASAATATDTVPAPWVIVVAWVALAGLLAWSPVVDHLWSEASGSGGGHWSRRTGPAVAALGGLALASVAGPVLAAQERVPEPVVANPGQWAQVAEWAATAPPGRVLVLPAVVEGRVDPVVAEALGDRPWIARDSLPLSGAAATAALDDVVGRLDRGHDGAGTAAALRHLGISYVLLRNDVPAAVDRVRPIGLVRHALSRQGASRVAVLEAPSSAGQTSGVVDLGVRDPAGTLEIWAVDEAADGSVHDGAPLSVVGDSGVIGDLADAGLEPEGALVLRPGADGTSDAVSDSARRRDVDQRVASDPFGPVVAGDESRTSVPRDAARVPSAFRGLTGARDVRASSSSADLGAQHRRTGAVPSAAVDGNGFTAWQSRSGTIVGEWWEIAFDGPTDLTDASLQVVQNAFASHLVSRVALHSDDGTTEVDVPADGVVGLAAVGRTDRLRVQGGQRHHVARQQLRHRRADGTRAAGRGGARRRRRGHRQLGPGGPAAQLRDVRALLPGGQGQRPGHQRDRVQQGRQRRWPRLRPAGARRQDRADRGGLRPGVAPGGGQCGVATAGRPAGTPLRHRDRVELRLP
jgi:arabinofuranan 3-O-arabinosyltransferase